MQTASLDLFRVPSPRLSLTTPIELEAFLILQLPTLLPDIYMDQMVCSSSPHSDTRFVSSSEPTVPERRSHHSSFNNAIIVFNIDFFCDTAQASQRCSFVLHRHALLSRINVLDETPLTGVRTIPWEVWHPPTWWFNRNDVCFPVSYGQRYVQMPSAPTHPRLRVLDFNPHDIGAPEPQYMSSNGTSYQFRIERRQNFHPVHAVFAVDVWMSLPFTVRETIDDHYNDDYLMDDESVIGLRVSLFKFAFRRSNT
jgi:hypothetical protein